MQDNYATAIWIGAALAAIYAALFIRNIIRSKRRMAKGRHIDLTGVKYKITKGERGCKRSTKR